MTHAIFHVILLPQAKSLTYQIQRRYDMSDSRTASILSFAEHSFGPDETFLFHCTACGACCKGRHDILVTPWDLYRLAGHLHMEMNQLIQTYCIWYLGETSHLPIVALKMQGAEEVCPFLKGRLCGVQEAKPSVCALFPLGRMADPREGHVRYFIQPVNCGLTDESHTVREWISVLGAEESEVWYKLWSETVYAFCTTLDEIAGHMTPQQEALLATSMMVNLYVHYDMDRPFFEQFEKNADKVREILKMCSTYVRLGKRGA